MRAELMEHSTAHVSQPALVTVALPCLPHIDPALCSLPGKGQPPAQHREDISFKNPTHTIKESNKILGRVQLFLLFCTQLSHRVFITALQAVVKCHKTPSGHSNQYLLPWNRCLHHSHSAETSVHPYNCSVYPTDSHKFWENSSKKN